MAAYILSGFPVRSPCGGGSLQAPLCPPPGLSPEKVDAPKEIIGNRVVMVVVSKCDSQGTVHCSEDY